MYQCSVHEGYEIAEWKKANLTVVRSNRFQNLTCQFKAIENANVDGNQRINTVAMALSAI